MRPFEFSPLAEQDLQEIWDYIAADSEDQADRVILAIRRGVRLVAEMPGIGHHRDDLPDLSLRVWTVFQLLDHPQTGHRSARGRSDRSWQAVPSRYS